jgi:hypothetical protein
MRTRSVVSLFAGLLALAGSVTDGALEAAAPAGSQGRVQGIVYDDANRNGRRDPGESGIADVVVSDQREVVVTGEDGRYTLGTTPAEAVVFVSLPDGWVNSGPFWLPVEGAPPAKGAAPAQDFDFALARRPAGSAFTFLHASDTHLDEKSLPRLRRLREIVEEKRPDFVLITGDLVRDALRVGEAEARPLFDLVAKELAQFPVLVRTVPGNHDVFGIELDLSHVSPGHPLYGRAMYRRLLGPDFHSFTWGGVHFLGLDSVDIEDTEYYGHLDRDQLAWVTADLARVPAAMPVVTFNHIPLATSVEALLGYREERPAPSVVRIGGKPQYRHVVSNLGELLPALGGHRLEIALGGHMHASERLSFDTAAGHLRFHQTGAVVGPSGAGGMDLTSGVTLYKVRDGRVDDGTFLPLDAPPPK